MFHVSTIHDHFPRTVPTYAAALDYIAREFPSHPRTAWHEADEGPDAMYVYPDAATYDADGAPLACICAISA